MPDSGGGFEAPIPQVGDLVVSPREASGLIVRGVTTPEGCSFNLESRGEHGHSADALSLIHI